MQVVLKLIKIPSDCPVWKNVRGEGKRKTERERENKRERERERKRAVAGNWTFKHLIFPFATQFL
jgi:hypothetical protein